MQLTSKKLRGFTLLELMTVVVIILILAAISIPLVNRYLKKSKNSEASLNLRKIYDGEVGYFVEEHTKQDGSVLTKQFVATNVQPSYPPGIEKRLGNFETEDWHAIRFGSDGPVQYCYQVVTGGSGLSSSFTARAEGDIDGDGATSLFERVATVNSVTGEVEGGGAIFELEALE
jgi:prepilin-type N-terminal cleavage/methylation domain-containing protein